MMIHPIIESIKIHDHEDIIGDDSYDSNDDDDDTDDDVADTDGSDGSGPATEVGEQASLPRAHR